MHTSCVDRMMSSGLFLFGAAVYRRVFCCVEECLNFKTTLFIDILFYFNNFILLLEQYVVPWTKKEFLQPRYGAL